MTRDFASARVLCPRNEIRVPSSVRDVCIAKANEPGGNEVK